MTNSYWTQRRKLEEHIDAYFWGEQQEGHHLKHDRMDKDLVENMLQEGSRVKNRLE